MKTSKELITAEFHCHTHCSGDSSNSLPQLVQAARERGLGRLAITDHNTIRCALKAREMDPELIIVGEEILTSVGEMIAYYVKEEIPKRLTPARTIELLKAQGAFITIPHPFDRRRHGWRREDLLEILPQVDGLEVFNARCLSKRTNARALELAREHGKLLLAGSDAHSLVELGLAVVRLPIFDSAEELRVALKDGNISGRLLSPLEHFRASALIALGKVFPKDR